MINDVIGVRRSLRSTGGPADGGCFAFEQGDEEPVLRLTLPSRNPPREVVLVLRHPTSAAIVAVKVNGMAWTDFDPALGLVKLHGLSGQASIEVNWAN